MCMTCKAIFSYDKNNAANISAVVIADTVFTVLLIQTQRCSPAAN